MREHVYPRLKTEAFLCSPLWSREVGEQKVEDKKWKYQSTKRRVWAEDMMYEWM